MEFVIHVLERFFQKSRDDATRVMLHVHNHGVGRMRGLYIRGGGDQRVTQVMDFARPAHSIAECVMEKEMRKI